MSSPLPALPLIEFTQVPVAGVGRRRSTNKTALQDLGADLGAGLAFTALRVARSLNTAKRTPWK